MSLTTQITEALGRHYLKPGEQMPGGIFVPECGVNGTGAGSRCDALYVGFTSTSGRLLVGHEIKTQRADWLRELDQQGKADFWADNCHEWWIVAPGPAVVPVDEVPDGWGLMYPGARGRRFQIVRKATTHRERVPSWEAVRSVMSRLDTLQRIRLADLRDTERKARDAAVEREVERRLELRGTMALTDEQAQRLRLLERVEHHLGAPLATAWDRVEGGVEPSTLAALLHLAGASEGLLEAHHDRWSAEAMRRAAQSMLDGLDAYAQAQDAVRELIGVRR